MELCLELALLVSRGSSRCSDALFDLFDLVELVDLSDFADEGRSGSEKMAICLRFQLLLSIILNTTTKLFKGKMYEKNKFQKLIPSLGVACTGGLGVLGASSSSSACCLCNP